MLTIFRLPIGWALVFLIACGIVRFVYGIIRGRRETGRLILGLALILRARRRDLPAVARSVLHRNTRKPASRRNKRK